MKYYSFTELMNRALHATDGDMGACTDVLINTHNWSVRYLVADTRRWLPGRHVVLAPGAFEQPFRVTGEGAIAVRMDKAHIKGSPPLPFEETITSERMQAVHAYYGWPVYWGGTGASAVDTMPLFPPSMQASPSATIEETEELASSSHLRSLADLREFMLVADEERVGYLHDFIIDTERWAVAYIVIDSRKWISGTRHLFPVDVLSEVSWLARSISLKVSADAVRAAPKYDPDQPLSEQVARTGS